MSIGNVGRPRTQGYVIGQKFQYLTIVGIANTVRKDGYIREGYVCQCACGRQHSRSKTAIKQNPDAKCASCAGKESAAGRPHNKNSVHPLYHVWRNMHNRCENPRAQAYYNYGARGIKVCKRWASLDAFIADMGACPKGLSLERRNNDKGYSPNNCYWATPAEQNNNTRANRWVTIGGERKTITQWASALGTTRAVVSNRISVHGWTEEAACTTPVKHYSRSAPTLTVAGVTRPAEHWAKALEISGAALKGRIDRGWTIEEACTTPKRKFLNV